MGQLSLRPAACRDRWPGLVAGTEQAPSTGGSVEPEPLGRLPKSSRPRKPVGSLCAIISCMPRRAVPFVPGAYYHVYNRGNNRGAIFFEPENYIYFLKGIKHYLMPVVDILAYCL